MERERLLELRARVLTRKSQHLCEVEQRVGVRVQHVRLFGEGDRLAREPLARFELAAPGEHLSTHLAPEDLRESLLARGGIAPAFEPLLGLVVSAEVEQRLGEVAAESREVAEIG
jgi:hypothetical protein